MSTRRSEVCLGTRIVSNVSLGTSIHWIITPNGMRVPLVYERIGQEDSIIRRSVYKKESDKKIDSVVYREREFTNH